MIYTMCYTAPLLNQELQFLKRVIAGNIVYRQGSLFWLQNTEGEPLVGVFATNHQPQVLPPYFAARKENLVYRTCNSGSILKQSRVGTLSWQHGVVGIAS
jgi:hypothetical protein